MEQMLFLSRGLSFVKNSFNSTIPEMKLTVDEGDLFALITRELRAYIENLEKIK